MKGVSEAVREKLEKVSWFRACGNFIPFIWMWRLFCFDPNQLSLLWFFIISLNDVDFFSSCVYLHFSMNIYYYFPHRRLAFNSAFLLFSQCRFCLLLALQKVFSVYYLRLCLSISSPASTCMCIFSRHCGGFFLWKQRREAAARYLSCRGMECASTRIFPRISHAKRATSAQNPSHQSSLTARNNNRRWFSQKLVKKSTPFMPYDINIVNIAIFTSNRRLFEAHCKMWWPGD